MIVAGVGLKSDARSADIVAAIDRALSTHGRARSELRAIATRADKAASDGLRAAAKQFGLPILAIDNDALRAVADRVFTRSKRALQETGLPSICETAALAGAGTNATLLGPRTTSASATCALAAGSTEAPA